MRGIRELRVAALRVAFGTLLALAFEAAPAQFVPRPVPEICQLKTVDSLADPEALREEARKCGDVHPVWVAAMDKLDAAPIPSGVPRWMPMPAMPGQALNRVTLEMDVFFDYASAYPQPVAFSKLADLVRRMQQAHEIELVTVSASVDAYEVRERPADIATARATVVSRYLAEAGVDPHLVIVGTQPADHDDTREGRARDRCARIKVILKAPPR